MPRRQRRIEVAWRRPSRGTAPAGTDAAAVDHLRSRRPRLRLRHLRAAHAAAHRPAGPRRAAGRRAQQPCRQLLGRHMQYVPAVAGGIFGLLGGYLTDLFGRRRVLVWSILLYAFSALAAGFSTSVEWLLFWRCCTFVGVCVEFVAAVAWLVRAVHRSRAARARRRLHAGVRFLRRSDGHRRLLPGRHLRPIHCPKCAAATRPGATR